MQFVRNAARGGWEGFCEETAIGRRFCQDAAKRQRPQGTVREGRGVSASVCRTARQQAASKARGCRQLRERGAADGREGAEERGRLQELEVAGGYGMGGGIADGCESIGPREATKARGRGRSRKRVAADGHESVGPRAAAKARSRRRPRGAEVTGSNGVSYNVSRKERGTGLGVATAGRIRRGSG